YFTLKDGASQIRGVIFRSALRYLKFKPADGLRVVARGRVSVYEPKGEYQLVCEHLEPHGLGALQLALDQPKKRLQEEGPFDAAPERSRISGRSTTRSSRAPSRACRCRSFRASATRPTLRSPISSPTCARRRRPRRRRSWSQQRTSSAAGSIGCTIACAAPRTA